MSSILNIFGIFVGISKKYYYYYKQLLNWNDLFSKMNEYV